MMNKKGSSIILMIFEVLFVVFVVFMAFNFAVKAASDETVVKENIANEFSLMVNTLVGTPGNAVISYPYNISTYSLILDNEKVTVLKKGDPEPQNVKSSFVLPYGYSGEGVVDQKDFICLQKSKKDLILRECTENER